MVITLRTMVRPWMVALLMLLTDRDRSFGISHGSAAAAHATEVAAAPATADEDVDVDAASVNSTEIASIGCNYKGRSYDPGSLVNTDQPCLKCTCVTGSLVCHLQVCPELPDPPPQGCVIVHKKNKCCAHLQCFYEQFDAVHSKLFSLQNRSGPARMDNSAIMTFDGLPKGCVINGTIYAEGSAMDSSSLCEYCYCIKGHQQCVRPQCSLTIPGCTAVYKKHTCCPIRYKCSQNAQIKNTTDATTTEMASSLSARLKDCRINGRLISLGEPVIGVARSSCETCFCINGQVRCDKVICPPIRAQISPNCGPVYSEGHCCPTSYNCTSTTSSNESHVSPTVTPTTMTSIGVVATTQPSTVIVDDDVLLSSLSPPSPPQTPTEAQLLLEIDSVPSSITVDSKNTTDEITEPIESRHGNPVSLMHDDLGGLNVTEKSNNFEMDYDDPTLPPSLPNLKIIPFVAADAVVDEPVAAYENYQPVVERVYNVSDVEEPPLPVVNSFSPPIETEGGFIPKDSPNSAIYTPDKFRKTTTTEQPIIHQREPVVGHQLIGSVWCLSNGKKYKHGELLTDPSACNICICFNAKIVCQENCPAVKVGCQRINDPNNSTCCGRIVCNEYENDITTEQSEHMKQIEVTSETSTTTTTMNVRDAVIEHIFSSTPPIDKSVITSSPTTLKSFHESTETSSLKPITTTTVKLIENLPSTTEKSNIISSTLATLTTIKRTEVTTSVPKPLEDEDYSFESMFSFLFSGDTPEQSSPAPLLPSSTNYMESETRIEHRTDDEIDEKTHLIDTKHDGQTDFVSHPKQQHKPILNSGTEIHSPVEDKHNKVEPQEVYKPVEFKPNTEIKQQDNDKLNSETKYFIDNKPPQSGTKQHVDVKLHQEIKQNATSSGIKQQAEVKTHFDVKENVQVTSPFNLNLYDEVKPLYHDFSNHQTEVKSHFSVKDNPKHKIHTDSKFQSDNKTYADFKHQSDINTHFDVKEQVAVKPYFDFKQQTKQHSNYKQQVDVGLQSEFKQQTEVKPNIATTPLKTKVDSEFNLLASLLKISGCNIYGRMYRVGKIIFELSNPCLECMCTEIGVHCNQLKC